MSTGSLQGSPHPQEAPLADYITACETRELAVAIADLEKQIETLEQALHISAPGSKGSGE